MVRPDYCRVADNPPGATPLYFPEAGFGLAEKMFCLWGPRTTSSVQGRLLQNLEERRAHAAR